MRKRNMYEPAHSTPDKLPGKKKKEKGKERSGGGKTTGSRRCFRPFCVLHSVIDITSSFRPLLSTHITNVLFFKLPTSLHETPHDI